MPLNEGDSDLGRDASLSLVRLVTASNLVVADVLSKRINESQLAPKSVKQAVESGRDNAGTRDLAPQSRVSARRLFSLP